MSGRVEDPGSGFGCDVPPGWEAEELTGAGSGFVMVEPSRPSERGEAFRANIVVTMESAGGLGFRDWQAGTDAMLPDVLEDYALIDLEKLDFAGCAGGRRLAHHAQEGVGALTMEQWFALVGGVGVTLTATTDTWRYDELADLFAGVAASVTMPSAQQGKA